MLGTIWPTLAASIFGPAAIIALGLLGLQGQGGTSQIVWLTPWVPYERFETAPPELVYRPAAWHVLYLFALATCLASLLRLIAANRKVRALGVAAASLVVILATAALQLAGPSSRQQARAADLLTDFNNHQDCAVSSMVQLCAYRAYSSWVRDWLAAVEGVLEAVPSHELPDRIRIRQLLEPLGSVAPPQISDRLVNRWQPGGRDRAQDLLPETELYVGSTWRRDDGRDAFALATSTES
jgi:hypothetical protein